MRHTWTRSALRIIFACLLASASALVATDRSLGQDGTPPPERLGRELSQQTVRLLTTDPLLNVGEDEVKIQHLEVTPGAAKLEVTIYMHVEGMLVAENINVYALHDGEHIATVFREPSNDFYLHADQIPSHLLPPERVSRWRELRAAEISANVASSYRLPFTGGETRTITRGGTSHDNAYDFAGDNWLIRAARGGIVNTVKEDRAGSCYEPSANYQNTCYPQCSADCCNNGSNYVSVLHPDGSFGFYLHVRQNGVIPSPGQSVTQGACLAYSGNVGCSTGPHLHFHVGSGLGIPYTRITWVEAPPDNPSLDGTNFTSPASQNSTAACGSNPCCGCLPAACCGSIALACDPTGNSATGGISFRELWSPASATVADVPSHSPIPWPAGTLPPGRATPTPVEGPLPSVAAWIRDETPAHEAATAEPAGPVMNNESKTGEPMRQAAGVVPGPDANDASGTSNRLTDTSPPTFEIVTAELPWTNDPQPPTSTWAAAADESKLAGYRVYWGDDVQGTGIVFVDGARYEPGVRTNNDTAMVRYLRVAAEDTAGNLSAWKTVAVWRYDPVSPSLTLSIGNGGPVVPTLNVTLNLVADDRGSGISQARFSRDGVNWTPWELYVPRRAWQLEVMPGSQAVYAQVRDAAGNLSEAAHASVTAVLNVELPSSVSYRIARSVFGMGGGAKTSTDYRVQGTSGQLSETGVLVSGSYRVRSGFWAGLTCPLAEPAGPPHISVNGPIVTLEWNAVAGASAYNIYRGTEPYFLLAAPYDSTTDTAWTDPGGGGDPSVNHYYVVKAVNNCGESTAIYRVGEFDFALTPGS